MKKILALLLTAVMVFCMAPAAALAADAPVEITAETYANSGSVALGGGRNYKILADEDVLIDEGQTWTVCEGSELFVYGNLDIKGTLIVDGYVTCIGSGTLTAKCWEESANAYAYGKIVNPRNVCGNESETEKHYFAEVHIPSPDAYAGFNDPAHKLSVKYLCSVTGSHSDYTYSDLYYPYLENPQSPIKWFFADVYTSPDYDPATGMLKVYLNQYLFLHFDFTDNAGKVLKQYDGNRMSIYLNRVRVDSDQGICSRWIDSAGSVEFIPTVLAKAGGTYNVWKDAYFLRQERIYLPNGQGYSTFGLDGEISADDQTIRLNYGDHFRFRVTIDDAYSDSAYSVYLVQSYQWKERNHEDTLDALLEEVYIDEDGNPQHFVWKFEPAKDGEQQKIYIDQYGIYHISSVDDEYTIVVSGVVSNETLSFAGNLMDTIRNLLNAIKQFFERVKQMLGL